MVATKRRFNPNLQKVRISVGGAPRREYVCTRCLKAGKVLKARLSRRPTSVCKTLAVPPTRALLASGESWPLRSPSWRTGGRRSTT